MHLPTALIAGLLIAAPTAASALEPASGPGSDAWEGRWASLRSLGLAGADMGESRRKVFDKVVLGLDGGIESGGIDARLMGPGAESRSGSGIRARIGYAFDRFVAYGAAGIAFASAEFARQPDTRAAGWSVGGGVEALLFAGVSARAEYVYVDLDRRSFDAPGDVSLSPAGGQFRAGLNVRF